MGKELLLLVILPYPGKKRIFRITYHDMPRTYFFACKKERIFAKNDFLNERSICQVVN